MSKDYPYKAIYVGRRLNNRNRTTQLFLLLPEKSEMLYTGIRGVYIGRTYECKKEKMARRPKRTDDEAIDNAEWDAADALVSAHLANKCAESKLKKSSSPALKRAIEALQPLFKNLDYFERKHLIEYLANQKVRK